MVYLYEKNLQGDVIRVLDNTGKVVVKYVYNAWGKMEKILDGDGKDISADSTHIGNINPIRYRSYYYDRETELYYLQSRYYDPETGRFINADDALAIQYNGEHFSYNLFAYLANDCINGDENLGCISAKALALQVIGAACGSVSGYYIGQALVRHFNLKGWKKWTVLAISTIGGFLLGPIFPIASIIYMAIRLILSVVGGVYLSKSNMPISSMMYEHGIWGGGRALSASNNKKIINNINYSGGSKVALQKLLKKETMSFFDRTMDVNFYRDSKDKDLAYSIGKNPLQSFGK